MPSPRRLASDAPGFEAELAKLLAFESAQDESVDQAARGILAAVRSRGDAALLELTTRFDRWAPGSAGELHVDLQRAHDALARIPGAEREALEVAAARIRAFHERQRQDSWRTEEGDGTVLGQQVTPLDRAGLYVPGGKAAYPSSVLMNAIAAKVAGVPELVMVTPTPGGDMNDYVLAAAAIAGVDRIVRIGGAQAVGALAFGTASVPAVDKIVGPGNAYVAAAKRQVFGHVGIDMVAGPSEILVIADSSANADWVAMDLFSQAEHDEVAQAILLTPDAGLIERVAAAMQREAPSMPRRAILEASLAGRGALIRVRDLAEACELANRIAPEHLELAVADPEALLPKIRHAGAIFLGHHASEAIGDYCAGPNHVLPTSRTARFSSPLGVYDFQKRSSVIRISPEAADRLGRTAATLARAEGLEAHARSAEYRFQEAAMKDPASLVRDEIRALQGYHVPPAEGLVKLDAMENPYPLPPDLARELGETLSRVAVNRYPHPGAPSLKRCLREAFSIPDALEVVLGNGSDEILQLIGMAVAKPGACVLSVEPAFAMFRISAIAVGLRYEGVALHPDFTLDEPALLAAIERHRPALTWIAYPNNPTGNLFPREAILRAVEASPGLVVVDEAYFPFAGGATLLDEVGRYPNLVLMRTVSKLGLAGLRLGFAVAPPAWAAELEKLRLPYNVNVLTAAAAELVLRHRDVLDGQTKRIVAERERLERTLDSLPGVTRFPSAANFVLARVPDAAAGFEGLKARGILVRTLHGSHPHLANCLRFTIGTPGENDRLAAALQQILA